MMAPKHPDTREPKTCWLDGELLFDDAMQYVESTVYLRRLR